MKKKSVKKLDWCNRCGSPLMKIYERKWDAEKCRFIVVETGQYNIAEKIQSSNNVSDLALYYKQLDAGLVDIDIKAGEDIIAGSDEAIPKNIHEFNEAVQRAYASYEKLPAELQAKFGSQAQYLDALSNGSYIKVINDYAASLIKVPEEPKGE